MTDNCSVSGAPDDDESRILFAQDQFERRLDDGFAPEDDPMPPEDDDEVP